MIKVFRRRHFYGMLLIDSFLVASCFYCAYLFRFEFKIPADELKSLFRLLPFLILVKLSIFFFFNLYHGMWRYTSMRDMINVGKAVFVSSLVIIFGVLMVHRFQGYPRSVFIIDGVLTLLAIGGIRALIRIILNRPESKALFSIGGKKGLQRKKVLLIGAGDAGEKFLRELQDNPRIRLEPVGFLDDDHQKRGFRLHGVPVLGSLEEINRIDREFDEILITLPSASGKEMRRIVRQCEKTGKNFRTLPNIGELIDGRITVNSIRKVRVDDLLDREEVLLDNQAISRYLKQKRILITGAGGSIGAELVRQICRFNPSAVALLEMSELNLFRMEAECKQRFGFVDTPGYLVDIRRWGALDQAFQNFCPQIVFHAAAYKHVPLQELHPWEAVYNNVIGTRNLTDAAAKHRVERFVLVSTDKAVRPVNVMGATKRLSEMLIESMGKRSSTSFLAVRFGNVIASSGSASRTFQDQIARGGPVTVTHPEVTRYFMSISEAAQLIIQAGAMGKGGETFILDMGKPVRILDVVHDLIRLNGLEPEVDIPIQFIGLRPGEKLYEELITEGEGIVSTDHDKILVLRGDRYDYKSLNKEIDELLSVADTYDATAIKKKLKEIIPEYTPQW